MYLVVRIGDTEFEWPYGFKSISTVTRELCPFVRNAKKRVYTLKKFVSARPRAEHYTAA